MKLEGGIISELQLFEGDEQAADLKTIHMGSDRFAVISHSFTDQFLEFLRQRQQAVEAANQIAAEEETWMMKIGKKKLLVIAPKEMRPFFKILGENDNGGSFAQIRSNWGGAPRFNVMYKHIIHSKMWNCKSFNIGLT